MTGNEEAHRIAMTILDSRVPLQYLEYVYGTLHYGDLESLRAVVYATCLQSSVSSKGLHPGLTGDKGRGKTSSIKAALHLMPQDTIISGSMSAKSFYYMPIYTKSTFFLDDIVLSDDLTSTLKRAMSNFQLPTKHHTVDKGKPKTVVIPPRCVFINTSVTLGGDDQLSDRQLLIGVTGGDDIGYHNWEQTHRKDGKNELPDSPEVEICRNIIGDIHTKDFQIHHHRKIEFAYHSDRRLMNILYDLIEASAILNYRQRKTEKKDDIVHVYTADEDLQNALNFNMFSLADKDTIGRVTKAEKTLDVMIQESINDQLPQMQYTEKQIAEIYNKSVPAIRKLLYGADGRHGDIKGGLCMHTKWYLPDADQVTRQNVILCKRHDLHHFENNAFAWWV